jgi:flagellar hook capping protein FlgD
MINFRFKYLIAGIFICLLAGFQPSVYADISWEDHFITGHSAGAQPSDWYDEFDPYGSIYYDATVSYANITITTASGSGSVTSSTFAYDLSVHPYFEIYVSYIETGADLDIAIQNPSTSYHFLEKVNGTGLYSYHIPTETGESGTQSYFANLKLWGNEGDRVQIDWVRFWDNQTPTNTPTNTNTPTASPTATESPVYTPTDSPTISPTPTTTPQVTPTPTMVTYWMEEFDGSDTPPAGWYDETNAPGHNINLLEVGGYGYLTTTGENYGNVETDLMTIDTDWYNFLQFDFTALNGGLGYKMAIVDETRGQFECNTSSITTAGANAYDFVSLARATWTDWTGVQTFKLRIWLENAEDETATMDYVRILGYEPSASATPTSTPTASPTPPGFRPIYFDYFDDTEEPLWVWTDSASDTGTYVQMVDNNDGFAYLTLLDRGESTAWGNVYTDLKTIDVDLATTLKIKVDNFTGNAGFKVAIYDSDREVSGVDNGQVLLNDPAIGFAGIYEYKYAELARAKWSDWSGEQTFVIRIWLEGNIGDTVTLDYITISGLDPTPTVTATATITPIADEIRPTKNMFQPARGPLQVNYGTTEAGKVKVTVYTALGRKVRTLVDRNVQGVFAETVDWDGRNSGGSMVASGVYIIRIETESYSKNIRVAVVK